MATTQVAPNAASQVEDAASESESGFGSEPVKQENVDYVRFQKLVPSKDDPNKQILDAKVYASPSDKLKADMAKDGYEIAFTQTVLRQTAGNWSGAEQIVADEEERTGIWNRGLMQKVSAKLNNLFNANSADGTAPEWTPIEGVYDPKALINEPTNRRNLTQDERTVKMLRDQGYSDAVIMAFFQAKATVAQGGQQ